jgi:signal transduction histidine kinase/Tfp pilus assembly protein PilF
LAFRLLLSFLFIFSFQITHGQTDVSTRIEWFESFFLDKPERNANDILSDLEEKIQQARDVNDKEAEAKVAKELGIRQMTLVPDYEKAIANFILTLKIEDSLQLRKEKIITYLAMSRLFEEIGDYLKSFELLENATELSRPDNDVNTLVFILNEQGKINVLMGHTKDALENYELVLKYKEQLTSRKPEADAYYNIGHLHMRNGNYDSALDYHKQSLAIRRTLHDKVNEAKSLNEIGELYRLMKNHEKALANHIAVLQIRKRLNDPEGLTESYNNIGILYYLQKDYDRAVANLQLGLEGAKDINSAEELAKSYEHLSLCYKETGDYRKALGFEESYSGIIEFMRSEKNEHELLERQNRYVLDKKEVEIRQLESARKERELKIESQKKIQNVLSVLIGFGVIIILLVLYLYLVKRRTNRSLEAAHVKVNQQNVELHNLNATKDKFFSIISHDLKGPLNSFTAFSGMLMNHTDSLTKEEIQMLAKEIDKNLKNLFALLENLLEWSRSQTGSIEFKRETFDLHELLKQNQELLAPQAKNKDVVLNYVSENAHIVQAHRHSINTVIRNLISNAIKFTPSGGSVTIDVKPKDANLLIRISDTGVGMAKETIAKLFRIDTKYSTNGTANEKGTGLGLILCKDFVEKNGGSIGVESEPGKGSIFFFTLPKPNLEKKEISRHIEEAVK